MTQQHRVLTSVRNPYVVELAKLHDTRKRRSAGLTIVEGPHQVADVANQGAEIREVFHLEGAVDLPSVGAGTRVTAVSQAVLRKLAGTEHPRGPLAVVAVPAPDPLEPVDSVVLWDVAEPRNVGAIVRTAVALGYAVVATRGTADVWSPKAVRAAAAAQFGSRVVSLGSDIEVLHRAGFATVAAVAAGGAPPESIAEAAPRAVLVGSEAHGLPGDVAGAATHRVTIPLQGGVESLNAGVAAALVMYALRRA